MLKKLFNRKLLEAAVENLVLPALRRAGTALGVWLATMGATQPQIDQIVAGGMALALFGIDLFNSYLRRLRS